jgi:hypothetical protein
VSSLGCEHSLYRFIFSNLSKSDSVHFVNSSEPQENEVSLQTREIALAMDWQLSSSPGAEKFSKRLMEDPECARQAGTNVFV